MLRSVVRAAAKNSRAAKMAFSLPATKALAGRYVPAHEPSEVIELAAGAVAAGRYLHLDRLAPAAEDTAAAKLAAEHYLELLELLVDHTEVEGEHPRPTVASEWAHLPPEASAQARPSRTTLVDRTELLLSPPALGQLLSVGEELSWKLTRAICTAAAADGVQIMIDGGNHETIAESLALLDRLRAEFAEVGVVLPACLRSSEHYCEKLAADGVRVRLIKGPFDEPRSVAYTSTAQVDRSFVRCLRILMEGAGRPTAATWDPRLIAITKDLAHRNHRKSDEFEFGFPWGVKPREEDHLVEQGFVVRQHLPFGPDWAGYLMRQLADRPLVDLPLKGQK